MIQQSAADLFEALSAPFVFNDEVSVRVGPTNEKSRQQDQPLRGQPLYYIDARVVMDRLDRVCGVDGWQCTYTAGMTGSIICNIGILFGDWIWKGDGAGATDMEADKGALSDAFKRAAVRFGIGRYLYDLKAPWIVLEQRGRSSFIPDSELPRLAQLHDEMARKYGWGEGAGIPVYRLLLSEVKTLAPASAEQFWKDNLVTIDQMAPAMRRHLALQIEGLRNAK